MGRFRDFVVSVELEEPPSYCLEMLIMQSSDLSLLRRALSHELQSLRTTDQEKR